MVATSGKWGRLARSLVAYVDEADRLAPNRSTASDGSIASDAHHSQNPGSDHEPDDSTNPPLVHAVDLTDDPEHGWDSRDRLDEIRRHHDARVKYGISDREMFSSYPTSTHAAWTWRPYRGANPHTKHGHLSIWDNPSAENDTSPWFPAAPTQPQEDDDMRFWLWSIKDDPGGQVWAVGEFKRKVLSPSELEALVNLDGETGGKYLWKPAGAQDPRYPAAPVRMVPQYLLDAIPLAP